MITEPTKTLATFEKIVDAFSDFGLIGKEPMLVVGGGLISDVAGFACASYLYLVSGANLTLNVVIYLYWNSLRCVWLGKKWILVRL